ncbi:MAG: ROK family protein [Alphaproteobacteria bacterium]|nr:ROK family protein [Alphaproteobacteria bacterium]
MSLHIGIDLGGTKIEGIAIDSSGRTRAKRRVATPAGDYAATVRAIAMLADALENEAGESRDDASRPRPIGVGIPGVISPATGLVKNANSTCLIGRPLDKDLAVATGRAVRLANDANCFAVSEAVDGAGQGHLVVFGVILGTGVGGGIAINGRALLGANAIAGEWGHNPLPWPDQSETPGPLCYCGKRGCVETFLSGPGLLRDHHDRGGTDFEPEVIAARAGEGDTICLASLARYEERLARALATIINVLDPGAIVLGGGLSNIQRLYENVPRLWQRWVFSDRAETPLLPNRHGDSSGVRGAAWLWRK